MFKELKPKGDEEWLKLRAKVLTATDMGGVLGLNPWPSASIKNILANKKQYVPFENAYTYNGITLEPKVVDDVNKVLGTNFKLFENGTRSFFADVDFGLGATPDAGEGDTLLECKTTKPGNALKYSYHPPAYYLGQLYTQMYCTGRQTGLLAITSTNFTQYTEELNLPISIFEIKRFKAMDDLIVQEVTRFWETLKIGKMYRVNRKQGLNIEFMLRFKTRRIYK